MTALMRFLPFIFLLVPGYLLAVLPTVTGDTLLQDSLREVVVTAQRREANLFETPSTLAVLSAKALRLRQARTVPEALVATSGVFNQSTSRSGSPFLRGLTGNQTLLLVDGIRLNNATFRYGPNQYLNTLDPFSLSRIEVLKGGGSVAYGSDALGGTIQVFSVDPLFTDGPSRWGGRALGQFQGRDMEQSGHLDLTYGSTRAALTGGLTLRNFGDVYGGKNTGRQTPSGYDERAWNAKARFRLAKSHFLTFAQQSFAQKEQPVYHKIQLENFLRNHFTDQKRALSYARWQHQPEGSPHRLTATISMQNTLEGRESQKKGSAVKTVEEDRVRSLGLGFQLESTPGIHLSFSSGVEVYRDLVHSTRSDRNTATGINTEKRGLYPDGATHLSAAAYALATWDKGRWQLAPGLRYNYFSIKVPDADIGESHLQPSALVGSMAVLYRVSASVNGFAHLSTAFRAPNIDDLGTLGIVDFRYEVPTQALKPESALNMELGIRARSEWLRAELSVYHNRLNDLIVRIREGSDSIAGYPVYRKENVQKGYIQGIEGDVRAMLGSAFSLEAALAWQYGQNVTRGEPMRRIPPLFGRVGLEYVRSRFRCTLESLFADRQERLAASDISDNRIPTGGTPGWAVFNVYGEYALKKLSFRMGFWNLFDEDYRYHGSGINAPGRNATLGVEYAF